MRRWRGSMLDCCIAQTAIHHQTMLVHHDQDSEAIAQVRSLQYYDHYQGIDFLLCAPDARCSKP
jgi:hypothetical protein